MPILVKKPPITIACGPGKELRKLMDMANGKGKNIWAFTYALPVDLKSNG